jgi:hypothetical protein
MQISNSVSESVDAPQHPLPMPSSIASLFGSTRKAGPCSVPAQVWLTAAFGELKLDLREASFPEPHVLVVAESLCSSVEVLLPEGVSVVDHTRSLLSSHKVLHQGQVRGPVVHLDGWSVCSDVTFVSH